MNASTPDEPRDSTAQPWDRKVTIATQLIDSLKDEGRGDTINEGIARDIAEKAVEEAGPSAGPEKQLLTAREIFARRSNQTKAMRLGTKFRERLAENGEAIRLPQDAGKATIVLKNCLTQEEGEEDDDGAVVQRMLDAWRALG